MLRHFMSERFGSKNASARFSSQSWARFMIQKRQDIEEMTTLLVITLIAIRLNWSFPNNSSGEDAYEH